MRRMCTAASTESQSLECVAESLAVPTVNRSFSSRPLLRLSISSSLCQGHVTALPRRSPRLLVQMLLLGLLSTMTRFAIVFFVPPWPSNASRLRSAATDTAPVVKNDATLLVTELAQKNNSEPWKQIVRSASDFFEETMRAALQGRAEQLSVAVPDVPISNSTEISSVLSSAGKESVADLHEALTNHSDVVSGFLEQAKSLASPRSVIEDGLKALFRSITNVEKKVEQVVVEASEPSLPLAAPVAKVPSPFGLVLHDAIARRGPGGRWVVPIQAWIYRRNDERHHIRLGLCRKLVMEMIHGIKDISEEGLMRYEERGRLIFRTLLTWRGGERDHVLEIKFDGEEKWRQLPPTGGNGRVEADISVAEEIASQAAVDGELGFAVRIAGGTSGCEDVTARSTALLLDPDGLLVISDIDDTVKVTEVFRGKDMVVRNTFLEEFRPVEGMSQLYTSWAQDFGAKFAFVSNSPPEFHEPLRDFLVASGFPKAALYLRPLTASKEDRRNFKQQTISELLRHYPRRKVILVGDSGERDAAIFSELLWRHPVQVEKVLIRQVSPELPVNQTLFDGIPSTRWQVFSDPSTATLPEELRNLLGAVLSGLAAATASAASAASAVAFRSSADGKEE